MHIDNDHRIGGLISRNLIIDILKTLGIFLVIVGHNTDGLLHQYIYSFHMPMFFILAGYFYKEREVLSSVKHDFKRILLPYILYFLVVCFLDYMHNGISLLRLFQDIIKVIWGSVIRIDVLGHHVQGIGYLWFLPALFVCKNVFNFIYNFATYTCRGGYKEVVLYVCVFLFMWLGYIVHHELFPLPIAITTGLNALGYYTIGYLIKKLFKNFSIFTQIKYYYRVLIVILWIILGRFALNGMGTLDYRCIPCDYIAAIVGTITCYYIAVLINKCFKSLSRILSIIGQYTISILLIHQLIASFIWYHKIDIDEILIIVITCSFSIMYVMIHYLLYKKIFL